MRFPANLRRLAPLAGGLLAIGLVAMYPLATRPDAVRTPGATPLAPAPTGGYEGPATPTVPPVATAGPYVPALPTRLPVPPQPIPFPHVTMVSRGIPCLFCHASATRSPAASIPSVYQCMGCHMVIGRDSPLIAEVRGYWERQEAIPWVRLYRLPRFVRFSHRPHLAVGLNCEGCHGDVGQMEVTVPVSFYKQMGWCLECHEHQPNPLPLTECQICHY